MGAGAAGAASIARAKARSRASRSAARCWQGRPTSRAMRPANNRATMNYYKCNKCGATYINNPGECWRACGGSIVKRQAKRIPARGSHQRRVGRSASDGQPEAVARLVGRKKAVSARFINKIVRETTQRIADHVWERMTWWERQYNVNAGAGFIQHEIKSLMAKAPNAASRRRQRVLPANDEPSESARTK